MTSLIRCSFVGEVCRVFAKLVSINTDVLFIYQQLSSAPACF